MRRFLGLSPTTLRWKLMLTVGAIIVICQVISILWLWHESREQVAILVQSAILHHDRHRHYEKEVHEAVASLAIPSLLIIIACLLLCFNAIRRVTRPLADLSSALAERSEDNLEPLAAIGDYQEIGAVVESINTMMARLTVTLERERLFTADVAHELRTPLAGLRLHLQLIEKKHALNLSALLSRLDQMTDSVTQLLKLARVGQSFAAGSYQYFDIATAVIAPMVSELERQLTQRHQSLIIDLPDTALCLRGDITLLQMVVQNLIQNAHRYSPESSTIRLRLYQVTHGIALDIDDEGPGIDLQKATELSKAFVRMDRRYEGIGLGLNIVQRICQLHRAQFSLTNRDPHGCRATVIFSQQSA
ncbi:two-component system sensor histidine kinase PmrB [Rosenbergiella collisarenosi]|uniref:two-component system sensor histidine kinase PmrB n=1 Tax=Rosenbergiella collisarenosi TaxID=1544695 RepID=UPI001BD9DCEF|nr:two-component system sensor histidine kinase PmrB [Rosenbergiella collisarenosi]MBT0720897.1 two-component system sensor histidine kinase PmrB [Rosenbergiella collisarenosi]